MLPISLGMLNAMQVKKGSNIGKAMLLGISYASLIGSIGLPRCAISTVYAKGIFESMLGYSWSYIKMVYCDVSRKSNYRPINMGYFSKNFSAGN